MSSGNARGRRVRLLPVIAVAGVAAIAIVIWLVAIRDGDEEVATAMSVPELSEFAADQDHTVYWAGERSATTYEVTRTANGNIFVRYLDSDADVGDERPDFLTVGAYPMDDAFEVTTAASEVEGAIVEDGADGALVVSNETAPTSAYIAYPGMDVQIEVYHPDPGEAIDVATSGAIQPIS